jgi:hypothetical protein
MDADVVPEFRLSHWSSKFVAARCTTAINSIRWNCSGHKIAISVEPSTTPKASADKRLTCGLLSQWRKIQTVPHPKHEFSPTPSEVLRFVRVYLRRSSAQGRQKSKAADWAMVALTFLTATAAFVSAWLFQAQLTDARKSFRVDERAWIEVDIVPDAKPEPTAPKAFNFRVYPKNIGKTVARNVSFGLITTGGINDVRNDPKGVAALLDNAKRSAKGRPAWAVFAPNITTPVGYMFQGEARTIDSFFFVIGYVEYLDEFHVFHWKTFCFASTEIPGEFEYCPYGNDEDSNPE